MRWRQLSKFQAVSNSDEPDLKYKDAGRWRDLTVRHTVLQ